MIFLTPLSAQITASKFQNLSQIPLKNRGVWLKHALKILKTHSNFCCRGVNSKRHAAEWWVLEYEDILSGPPYTFCQNRFMRHFFQVDQVRHSVRKTFCQDCLSLFVRIFRPTISWSFLVTSGHFLQISAFFLFSNIRKGRLLYIRPVGRLVGRSVGRRHH